MIRFHAMLYTKDSKQRNRINVIVSGHFLLIATFAFCGQLSAQTTADIAEDVGKSVVMIVVYDATGSAVGQGSGVFVTNDGRILTNAHVLEDAYSAEVISNIGTFDRVQILYKDEKRDLGFIRVTTEHSMPPRFPNITDFKAGQRVIAIGNPLGLEKTVSDGLISGIRRTEDGVELIQTTVPISPGSSGGVLLNEQGLVIGITTSTFRGGQNINFAISLNTIQQFIEDYRKADPQGTKFEELKPAKESIWYRVVLHWIGIIFALLLGWIFGSYSYYVYPLVIIVGYIIYVIVKGLWRLVSYPFRKAKERKEAEAHQAYMASQPMQSHPAQSLLFNEQRDTHGNERRSGEETVNDDTTDDDMIFFCPKCGHRYDLASEVRGHTIECVSCHKRITVPSD